MELANSRETAIDRKRAAVAASLPGWHVWYVPLYNNLAGTHSWSAMPEGAGRAAVITYDTDTLVARAREWAADIDRHIKQAREELDQCPEHDRAQREMLEADLAAFERLARQ